MSGPALATRSESTASVYECIVAVSSALAEDGIAKTRKNEQQGYKFRGIDEVLNALSPLLVKYRLVILPRILSRTVIERQAKSGGVLFNVTVEAEFDFVSAADGSMHTVKTYGEAMDSADKATNKAMSAAYKYAAFQTFCIPTEGDNDADAHTPEPAPVRPSFVKAPANVEPETARPGAAQSSASQPPAGVAPSQSGDSGQLNGTSRPVTLPAGARRIAKIGPGRAGAHGEIFFEGDGAKGYMVWKASVVADAERFQALATPVVPEFKKSVSGNERIEALREAGSFR